MLYGHKRLRFIDMNISTTRRLRRRNNVFNREKTEEIFCFLYIRKQFGKKIVMEPSGAIIEQDK
jgi:hypothetical protein